LAVALDLEVAERHLMAVKGVAEHAGRIGEEGEVELQEELRQGAPGEKAGSDGVGREVDGGEDLGEDVVWQRAEAIHVRGFSSFTE
jgi:hypothetical protein